MINQLHTKAFHKEKGRISIDIMLIRIGTDISLTVTGGDRPHIGSVILSTPRVSLADPKCISSTSSVMNVISHKDEFALRRISEKLAAELGCIVSVSGGIHLDDITKDEIKDVLLLINELAGEIIAVLKDV